MKKTIIAILSLCMIMSFTTMAIALDITGDSATCPGPTLTFTGSPSVGASAATAANTYAITAASTKTDTETGIEYGILSSSNAVYQREKTTAIDVGPADVTSSLSLPGDSWTDKSGAAPSAS